MTEEAPTDGSNGSKPAPATDEGEKTVSHPHRCEANGPTSLSSSASRMVCSLISCGILLAHALLLWGQIDPQWSVYVCKCCNLVEEYDILFDQNMMIAPTCTLTECLPFFLLQDDQIDVDIAASNRTEGLIDGMVDKTSKSFDHNFQYELIALTYFDIIKELWKMNNAGAQFAAFILFLTGAIWPHCMLLLLHIYVSLLLSHFGL